MSGGTWCFECVCGEEIRTRDVITECECKRILDVSEWGNDPTVMTEVKK